MASFWPETLEAPDRKQTTVLGSQVSLGSHRIRDPTFSRIVDSPRV